MTASRVCKECAKPIHPLGKSGYCKACVKQHVIRPRAVRSSRLSARRTKLIDRLVKRDTRRLKKLFSRPPDS